LFINLNIDYGEAVNTRELIEIVATNVEGTDWQETLTEQADIVGNPDKRQGAWGACDTRVCALGWSPTPLDRALASYVDGVRGSITDNASR
jgi:hypothetical protein